ncbi:MAG: hypothetical protein V1685_06210 [Parcubacteria group bacterium]
MDHKNLIQRPMIEAASRSFESFHPLFFSAHPESCCKIAREWFRTMARAHASFEGVLPSWITEQWEWGVTRWPIHWCEVVREKHADCAAFAALAREALLIMGERHLPAQTIEVFDHLAAAAWQSTWFSSGGGHWLSGPFAFHEVIALINCTERGMHTLRVWDPTNGSWVERQPTHGYGSVVALRVIENGVADAFLRGPYEWHGKSVIPNEWLFL